MHQDEPVQLPASTRNHKRLPRFLVIGCGVVSALMLGLLVVLCTVVSVFFYRLSKAPEEVEAQLAAIREAGLPVTLEELDAWYPPVPDEDNAALAIQEAFEAAYKLNAPAPMVPLVGELELPHRTERLPDEVKRATAELLDHNQVCLAFVHKAVEMEQCRFPIDLTEGFEVGLGHCAGLRTLTELLVLDALIHVEQGAAEAAYASLMDAILLGRTLKNEPLLISQLVRIALHNTSIAGLERTLNHVQFEDIHLASLAAALASEETSEGLLKFMVGERCMVIGQAFRPMSKGLESAYGSAYPLSGLEPGVAYLKRLGYWDLDCSTYLGIMGRFVDLCSEPPVNRLALAREAEDDIQSISMWQGGLSRATLPRLMGTVQVHDSGIIQLRIARTVLAIERYRLKNHRLPKSLADLVPAYLDSVPIDAYDGNPLRYTRTEHGYVVYTIGPDLEDDGGIEAESAKKAWTEGDWTFTVER
ncbi:MAG TPA: hypothetical protein HPP77_08125 [Candidatus Hydrogenedentes bacterium]|nr:hypothetical protein [Candidatus Hydrogenedentota bacterium]HIJ72718.1 hypothetical protein [Candidatus Hydrogenedentota bacterium]